MKQEVDFEAEHSFSSDTSFCPLLLSQHCKPENIDLFCYIKLELDTLPSISKNKEKRIPNIKSWPMKCIFYVFMFNAMQLLHTAGNIDTDYRCQNIW